MRSSLLRGTMEIVIFVAFLLLFLVCTQDIQVFPYAAVSLLKSDVNVLTPPGVERAFLFTEDGKKIETWRLPSGPRKEIALIFHGNGYSLEGFHDLQQWFKEQGITSYLVDYRGYGRSSGWPSERGTYIDAETAWKYVLEKENIDAGKVIILGQSIGSAPAAYLAAKYGPKCLILLSPLINIYEAVQDRPILGLLAKFMRPFLWYDFPVGQRLAELKETKLIVAHGKRDSIIPVRHSEELRRNVTTKAEFVFDEEADHNDLFWLAQDRIRNALSKALSESN